MAPDAKENIVSAPHLHLSPLEAMKLCGSSMMLTLLSQLTKFRLSTLNKFFSGYAVNFHKLLKSNELCSNPPGITSGARMNLCLKLLDSIK